VNRQGRIEKARASSAASESALGPGEHDTTHSAQNRSYRELEQENKKLAQLLKLTRQQKQRDVKTAAARGATAKTAKQSKRARAKNLREKEDAARKKGKERERERKGGPAPEPLHSSDRKHKVLCSVIGEPVTAAAVARATVARAEAAKAAAARAIRAAAARAAAARAVAATFKYSVPACLSCPLFSVLMNTLLMQLGADCSGSERTPLAGGD
jgi:hypothetical protein